MHRAIFLSDFHLGSRLAKAEQLLAFIESQDAESWYLVGDIYDIKRLRKRAYWPDSHGEVVRALRRKARAGARVVYLPGNHDPELHARTGARRHLPGIEVRSHALHDTADGRRLLVIHGDRQEPDFQGSTLSYAAGCAGYFAGVAASELVGRVRAELGLDYWSLSGYMKDRTLPRVPLLARYRANLRDAARAHGADGVVCGHIHHAAVERDDGVLYFNCGDWVDSCTALVERPSGALDLMRWSGSPVQQSHRAPAQAQLKPVPAR